MTPSAQHNRGTIFVEDAQVLCADEFPGEQYVLRLHAPKCAASASAGSFVHVQCDATIPMRRPLSIMRSDPIDGWIEILFKTVGTGLLALANKNSGQNVSILGPIGHGFTLPTQCHAPLLIGGGVGIPPMIYLAESFKDTRELETLVIMGSEIPFPFETIQSQISTPWIDENINQSMRLLEERDIPSRLASLQGYSGCYNGYVTDLARQWLQTLTPSKLAVVTVFSCGPTAMLRAVADLADEFELPCQVALEEYMACAVGGCAGCTVSVQTEAGPAMKRVCVDGPVFNAADVFSRRSDVAAI